ncbi:AraC-like transcriptional regulator QhpR [Rhodovulum steppense]|uniref:AraC-like DNA-binding protein n=1 Tax=Rhodovulum steppense TaxID=540251 RepID=A0A4V2R4H0_9RHOB|nr:AraC family transcriptional regulator [Rhodovulum steppense]TCM82083.1 AraC-like DNA-binding protein [Rhodovulum steppense]
MDASWILSRPYTALVPPACADTPPAMALAEFVSGLERMRADSSDPLVSWRQGLSLAFADLGPLGEAVARATTLGAALRCLAQGFPALQSGTSARFEVDGDCARFTYRVLDCRIWPRRADSELTLGVVARIAGHFGAPPTALSDIAFEHAPCARTAPLAAALRRPPRMAAPENAIAFPVRMLDRRAPTPDDSFPEALRMLDRTIAEHRRSERLSSRVRFAIFDRIGHAPVDQDAIARHLGLSRRSLRRHLDAEGTSFADLLAECRRACGHAMLTRTALPLSEIALALGYSDQTAFSRAFSRWFGESPRELRRSGGREESVIR